MPDLSQLLRFAVVGGLSTVADWGALALAGAQGIDARLANPFCYALGIGTNFLGSRHFTFRDARQDHASHQAVRFLLVHLAGLAIDQALVMASRALTPAWGLPLEQAHWPGKAVALVAVATFNFLMHRCWTFRVPNA